MANNAFETKRIEELFKYFQAASHAIGLADNDVECEQQYDPSLSRISLDPVLNALCQLGAYRLDCDRAFISLIDHEHQYIVSEMTKSISLTDSSRHNPGDGVCLGARPLDLFAGVCAGTMPAFTQGGAANEHHLVTSNIFADTTRYIINDFSIEPKYKDRPYVQGYPHMRYYAEVPIKTSLGYVIGTYSVVDNKPRQGLDEQSFLALNDIATSIMRHIEMVKMQDDYARSSRLLRGLDSLVQDTQDESNYSDSDSTERSSPKNESASEPGQSIPGVEGPFGNSNVNTTPALEQARSVVTPPESKPAITDQSDTHRFSTKPTSNPASDREDVDQSTSQLNQSGLSEVKDTGIKDVRTTADLGDFAIDADIRNNLCIAAESLRVAMDLDCVVFLDASASRMTPRGRANSKPLQTPGQATQDVLHGGDAEASDVHRTLSSSSLSQETSISPNSSLERFSSKSANSRTLGVSTSSRIARNTIEPPIYEVPEALHQTLLIHYPNGRTFNFGVGELLNAASYNLHQMSDVTETSKHLRRKASTHTDIPNRIRAAFPLAKSLIFLPLWNTGKRSWFAGCLGWSSQEKRVLQPEDLSYFNIFGNSLMAKADRLELVATDQAKLDFISCISHELRSPLHGILGSTELLKEMIKDDDQQQMISMLEQCGRTLLDTMNHVLDYSKINSITRDNQRLSDAQRPDLGPGSEVILGELSFFDLGVLIEESVETLVAGHQHNSKVPAFSTMLSSDTGSFSRRMTERVNSSQLPIVILNVEHQPSWVIESETASWRRCTLNILGNALKYTNSGFIEVILRSTAGSQNSKNSIKLIIRDTGQGIGKTYLENHLFRPFVQENALSNGTGLGLSIVKSLVDEMDGQMDVQSEVGLGTQVEISVPMNFVSTMTENSQMLLSQDSELTFCFVGFEAYSGVEKPVAARLSISQQRAEALRSALSTHLADWLGMKIIYATNIDSLSADVIVVDETNLGLLRKEVDEDGHSFWLPAKSALLVLCTEHSMYYHSMSPKSDQVHYLSQPFGPHRLATFVSNLLQFRGYKEPKTSPATKPHHVHSQDVVTTSRTTSVASDAQKIGSTVSVTEITNPAPSSKPSTLSGSRILLVDDNDVNLQLLVRCMQRLKLQYHTASNGAEAVEEYKNAEIPFTSVFMDISMPIMDGFAATRAIRDFEQSSGRPATQIIAMTGLGSPQARQEGLLSGMDLFLTKPVQMKQVQSLVQLTLTETG